MKKNTTKSSKTPAPAASKPTPAAAKSVAPAKTPRAKKTAMAPLLAPAAAAKAPAVKIPSIKVPTIKAPVVKEPAPEKTAATVIAAQIDIGFGNILFIRGEGAGLSWDQGTAMENVSADQWRFTCKDAAGPITFKFLVNDLTWSVGDDYVVNPGAAVTLEPTF
ncbi:MAG: hypothetical protein HZA31_12180 [Opitutae bacterium]|nr:hypothetical protein [Opitutae bacterium]